MSNNEPKPNEPPPPYTETDESSVDNLSIEDVVIRSSAPSTEQRAVSRPPSYGPPLPPRLPTSIPTLASGSARPEDARIFQHSNNNATSSILLPQHLYHLSDPNSIYMIQHNPNNTSGHIAQLSIDQTEQTSFRSQTSSKLRRERLLKTMLFLQFLAGGLLIILGMSCLIMGEVSYSNPYPSNSYHRRYCVDGTGIWGGILCIVSAVIGQIGLLTRNKCAVTAYIVLGILSAIVSGIELIMSALWVNLASYSTLFYDESGNGGTPVRNSEYWEQRNGPVVVINTLACLVAVINVGICSASATLMSCNATCLRGQSQQLNNNSSNNSAAAPAFISTFQQEQIPATQGFAPRAQATMSRDRVFPTERRPITGSVTALTPNQQSGESSSTN